MFRRLAVAVLAVAALTVAGCGGHSLSLEQRAHAYCADHEALAVQLHGSVDTCTSKVARLVRLTDDESYLDGH
jgi:hypothetical protein